MTHIRISPQSLSGCEFLDGSRLLERGKTSSTIHLHAFSHKTMMIKQRFKGIRLWSSLKGLIDHFTRRTWQASWAACRAQGQGHLHEEAALSGGSPDATLHMSYSTCLWSTKQKNKPRPHQHILVGYTRWELAIIARATCARGCWILDNTVNKTDFWLLYNTSESPATIASCWA